MYDTISPQGRHAPGCPYRTAHLLKYSYVSVYRAASPSSQVPATFPSCPRPSSHPPRNLPQDPATQELTPAQLGAQKTWHWLVAQPDLTGQCLLNVLLITLGWPSWSSQAVGISPNPSSPARGNPLTLSEFCLQHPKCRHTPSFLLPPLPSPSCSDLIPAGGFLPFLPTHIP